jgi:hypothetical protein
MAANTDLFKKLSRRWVGQIGAGGVADASVTTIPLSSSTNLPTGTAVVVVIDRVNSAGTATAASEETVIGVVSGNNLVDCVRGAEGTAQAHNAGAVVEVLVTAKGINDLIDGLLVQHDQLGRHTNITASNITASATLSAVANSVLSHVSASDITARTVSACEITFTNGDPNLGVATQNIKVAGSDPKRGLYVPASAMWPSTTAGCAALAQVESSTNDVNIKVLDFDGAGTSKESAEFGIQTPTWWDASTITVQFVWYATAGSGTVNWEAQAIAFSDDDALDAAYGTLQEVTDTLLATGDVHITAETSAITVAGTPAAGDWIQIRINRDPANDTNTSDARLMGVRVRFGMAQYNDA